MTSHREAASRFRLDRVRFAPLTSQFHCARLASRRRHDLEGRDSTLLLEGVVHVSALQSPRMARCRLQPVVWLCRECGWRQDRPSHLLSRRRSHFASRVVSLRITIRGPGMDEMLREVQLGAHEEQQIQLDGIPVGPRRVLGVTGSAIDGWPVLHGESDPFSVAAHERAILVVVAVPAPGVTFPGGDPGTSEGP